VLSMWKAGPEKVRESSFKGGVCVPSMCKFGVCDTLAVPDSVPGSRSRPLPLPSLSDTLRSIRFFSELGLHISVSRHCIASGKVSSSVRGFLSKRVKNVSIVSMESVEPSESSIDVSSICDIVSVSSVS
jgi:hypothetical protein